MSPGCVLYFPMGSFYWHPVVQHIGREARRIRRLKSLRWKVVQLKVVPYLPLDQSGQISTLKDIPRLKPFHKYSQINIAVGVRRAVNVRAEDIAGAHLHMPGQNTESLDHALLEGLLVGFSSTAGQASTGASGNPVRPMLAMCTKA